MRIEFLRDAEVLDHQGEVVASFKQHERVGPDRMAETSMVYHVRCGEACFVGENEPDPPDGGAKIDEPPPDAASGAATELLPPPVEAVGPRGKRKRAGK